MDERMIEPEVVWCDHDHPRHVVDADGSITRPVMELVRQLNDEAGHQRVYRCPQCAAEVSVNFSPLAKRPSTGGVDQVEAFYARVNARAEADMLNGRPIAGAHHRALEAEISAYRDGSIVSVGCRSAAAAVLLSHLDAWANHVRSCTDDECKTCEADFNLVVRAHAVWANSQRGPLAQAPAPVDKRVRTTIWYRCSRCRREWWVERWLQPGEAPGGVSCDQTNCGGSGVSFGSSWNVDPSTEVKR